MHPLNELTGQRFGRLLVVRRAGSYRGGATWLCRCDCGVEREVIGWELTSQTRPRKSCGCLIKEWRRSGDSGRTHGLRRHPLYKKWCGIKERCSNPNHKHWKDYGGRGIGVCRGWAESFESFLADVGAPPTRRHSIDRRDNDRGYDCGHCDDCISRGAAPNWRWATMPEQVRNSRTAHVVEHDGVSQCIADWATTTGIAASTISFRLRSGWSTSRALTEPVGPQRPKTRNGRRLSTAP